ncbi:MAG: nuclear transport factor 2 family protein [Trebonia sp.]
MPTDLESRIRRLEDRAEISELVIKYAVGVDRRDWKMFAGCFTDPAYTDFSELGSAAGSSPRGELVDRIASVLDGYTVTQHLSPNHLIEFDDADPDRAVCSSYMYAQHVRQGPAGGEFYLLRGWYANHVVRTPGGWRIERLIQHVGWQEGSTRAVPEAARYRET